MGERVRENRVWKRDIVGGGRERVGDGRESQRESER